MELSDAQWISRQFMQVGEVCWAGLCLWQVKQRCSWQGTIPQSQKQIPVAWTQWVLCLLARMEVLPAVACPKHEYGSALQTCFACFYGNLHLAIAGCTEDSIYHLLFRWRESAAFHFGIATQDFPFGLLQMVVWLSSLQILASGWRLVVPGTQFQ